MNRMLPLALFVAAPAAAQVNAAGQPANDALHFETTPVATFAEPWKLAFLPDGGMVVTEKAGRLWLVDAAGAKRAVAGVPRVAYSEQGGLLGVFAAPDYARSHALYFTYAEPGPGGSGLALARAVLDRAGAPRLSGLRVLWRQTPRGEGGQFGAYLAFAPDGRSLFLTSGERQRFTPAQDPDQALGKILHLTLDGQPAPDNPGAGRTGAARVRVTDPPKDTVAAASAPGRVEPVEGVNRTPAETWSTGHRNPYGLAFAPDGRLWETEMGPRGGDELNLIERGQNYGWPRVSYGTNYDGVAIAKPPSAPRYREPALYWAPSIAPAGLTFYAGALFPAWRGSAFLGALAGKSLIRVSFEGGMPRQADRWAMGFRVRDVVAGPDGALWLLEDGDAGRLLRLTPKG